MSGGQAQLAYDADDNIVYMTFPEKVSLDTREEIAAHFDRVTQFWRANAKGQKAYFVVDFDNVQINIAELEFYSKQTQRAHAQCAITSVRYGGDPLQRTVTRLAGMKAHLPSNIYETREEAIAVVRKLRRGEIATASSSTPPRE